MTEKKILVIGAGSWGTAIATHIAANSFSTVLSSSHQQVIDEINQHHRNEKSLPNIVLNSAITAKKDFLRTASDAELKAIDLVFVVTPSAKALEVFTQISQLYAAQKFSENCGFVICSKGFAEMKKDDGKIELMLLSDAFEKITNCKNYAVLSGPNFASEVAISLPTITSIACENKALFERISKVLNGKNFSAHYSASPRSAEICGITKNVMAIGCGIIDELDLGMNAKAALVVKGCNEIQFLCDHFQTSNDLENPHGFGDIFLTCSSEKSRNYSLGKLLAQEKSYSEIVTQTQKTYEGFSSAKDLVILSKQLGIRLDLAQTINEILTQKFSRREITQKIIKVII